MLAISFAQRSITFNNLTIRSSLFEVLTCKLKLLDFFQLISIISLLTAGLKGFMPFQKPMRLGRSQLTHKLLDEIQSECGQGIHVATPEGKVEILQTTPGIPLTVGEVKEWLEERTGKIRDRSEFMTWGRWRF